MSPGWWTAMTTRTNPQAEKGSKGIILPFSVFHDLDSEEGKQFTWPYYGADGGKTCCEALAVPAVTKCGGSTLPEHFMNRLLVVSKLMARKESVRSQARRSKVEIIPPGSIGSQSIDWARYGPGRVQSHSVQTPALDDKYSERFDMPGHQIKVETYGTLEDGVSRNPAYIPGHAFPVDEASLEKGIPSYEVLNSQLAATFRKYPDVLLFLKGQCRKN
ncbi:hypothetical protein V8E55_005141 [Tylopilus felleus]